MITGRQCWVWISFSAEHHLYSINYAQTRTIPEQGPRKTRKKAFQIMSIVRDPCTMNVSGWNGLQKLNTRETLILECGLTTNVATDSHLYVRMNKNRKSALATLQWNFHSKLFENWCKSAISWWTILGSMRQHTSILQLLLLKMLNVHLVGFLIIALVINCSHNPFPSTMLMISAPLQSQMALPTQH